MKKRSVLPALLAAVCLLASCTSASSQSSSGSSSLPEASASQSQAVSYTEEDVKNQFLTQTDGQANTIVDCVVAEDQAYDLMGVVQYVNEDRPNMCRIGFLSQDGILQPMGLYALPADDGSLTYLGNGQISVSLIQPDSGVTYQCKVTFSEENGDTSFQVWDSLSQGDPAASGAA